MAKYWCYETTTAHAVGLCGNDNILLYVLNRYGEGSRYQHDYNDDRIQL